MENNYLSVYSKLLCSFSLTYGQMLTGCLICDKEKHFYVSTLTSQYYCHHSCINGYLWTYCRDILNISTQELLGCFQQIDFIEPNVSIPLQTPAEDEVTEDSCGTDPGAKTTASPRALVNVETVLPYIIVVLVPVEII